MRLCELSNGGDGWDQNVRHAFILGPQCLISRTKTCVTGE